MNKLELWGGPECTVNRVGRAFRDQLRETGHEGRIEDLDRYAALGITAIRYPVLWERIAPHQPDELNWRWTDERLSRLRALRINPIAGLVHHGSGPRYTHLLADDFASGLATFAGAVAQRYTWLTDWTPVNEPVTTARFSALYGHWYPHLRDEGAFWTALLNQIDAIRLAMREIRRINPDARLIQTEDLGRTYATAALQEQAAFDNLRRWIGWDFLHGHVSPEHPLWRHLCSFGLEDRLRVIADDPCPPAVIGLNHYLTSDRFLDHRLQRYPRTLWGGNGRQPYADTEAVRVVSPPPPGFTGLLKEAWDRYRLPVALTEVHNGCSRDEQMRWFREAWDAALNLRGRGGDVRAVTSWALSGAKGWNRLLTQQGRYEPGAYDTTGAAPRATALASLLAQLSNGREPHPVMEGQGWWRRSIRFHHPVVSRPAPMREYVQSPDWRRGPRSPPVLITGATGTLGQALAAACRHREIAHVLTDRARLDLCCATSIEAALAEIRPWAVINAAGWVRVDDAEMERDACREINTEGAVQLARYCGSRDIPCVTFSSDLVFGGDSDSVYLESDAPAPLSVYGQSKAEAEARIVQAPGVQLIIRTAAFFSPFDPHNFAIQAVRAMGQGRAIRAASDQIISPTYVPHLCNATLDLLIDGADGIWHLANGGAVSWAEFARQLADSCGLASELIEEAPGTTIGWRAKRPRWSALGSEKGVLLPPLDEAIESFAMAALR